MQTHTEPLNGEAVQSAFLTNLVDVFAVEIGDVLNDFIVLVDIWLNIE